MYDIDAESLLRSGLPFKNKEVREIQSAIESIKADLKGRRSQFAASDITNSKRLLNQYAAKIIKSAPENHREKVQLTLNKMLEDVNPLEGSVKDESSAGTGSVQERGFLDTAFVTQDILAKDLTTLEELLVPDDYKRSIPVEYSNLPVLQGRAEVEFVIKKPDGEPYDVDGKLFDQIQLKMVIDGYNAPITGGNFVDLVQKGYYNNKKVRFHF